MSESVYKEPVVVICRQGHPRITSDKLNASMFYAEQHCVLVDTDNREINLGWRTNYSAQDLHIGITTPSLSGMVLNVSKSDCLGILPLSFAKEWEASLKLEILPCPIDNQLIEHRFIYHRRDEHNIAHQALRKHLFQELTKHFQK